MTTRPPIAGCRRHEGAKPPEVRSGDVDNPRDKSVPGLLGRLRLLSGMRCQARASHTGKVR
eukprot:9661370-Prorocentrum_lima.AAC.1